MSCDADDYTTYIDRVDPITGQISFGQPQVTGNGCLGFYLGEPNTGDQTISDTLRMTESLPQDVDSNGNPVHKKITLTLSDRNDEALLRQNAEGRIPALKTSLSRAWNTPISMWTITATKSSGCNTAGK